MALGPCSIELQRRRVEIVEQQSQYVTFLLDFLFQVGAVTEEDLSLVRGGGCLGERDRMRTLLDVLQGRGEEACRAFLHAIQRREPAMGLFPEGADPGPYPAQGNIGVHLKKHKEILGRQHISTDYLNIRGELSGDGNAGSFTEITLSRRMRYAVPLQHQHETVEAGDAFKRLQLEGGGQEQVCKFSEVCESLLSPADVGLTLLSGVAGSGKTTVVRRLICEWATREDSEKVVFSLAFRELNLIGEPRSLLELLCVHYSHLKPLLTEILASDPAQILLILDGLDEFRFPLYFDRTPKCSDPEFPQSMGEMVVNLIKGNLLPGISILLTSRSHAVSKVPPQLVTMFYSVLGFSVSQQQHYFLERCRTTATWTFVSSHKPLLLMCHIPAFCWIVATALQEWTPCLRQGATAPGTTSAPPAPSGLSAPLDVTRTGQSQERAVTITEIYCCFLKVVLLFHGEGREEGSRAQRLQEAPRVLREKRSLLQDLGAMAFKGLLERRFLFDAADLAAFSLSRNELSQTFLVEILKEDRASLAYEKSFYFIHTSVQEFLAALYYVQQSRSGSDPFSDPKHARIAIPPALRKVWAGLKRQVLGSRRLLHTHVKKVFHWSERHQSGHLDLFCRFVSGLLVPRTRHILDGVFPRKSRKLPSCSPTSLPHASSPPFLLRLLHAQLQHSGFGPERQVNTCHCLYEAQDSGLFQRLQVWVQLLAQQGQWEHCAQAERNWSELAFLLQLTPRPQELNLEALGLDAGGLRRLQPVLPLFSTLRLGQNPFGPEGAAVLSLALKSPDCCIQNLWVVGTGLGCEGLKILAEGLKDNRTVVDLRMAINGIGDMGVGCLAEVLRTNRTLKDIRLRDNQVTDKGVELLMAALVENTTLESLWLFDNKLTKDGVRKLREFAKSRATLDVKVCD